MLSDLVPALLERPTMPTIDPSQFLENVMNNLRDSNHFSVFQLAEAREAVNDEIKASVSRMGTKETVFKHTAVPTTLAEVERNYLSGVHSVMMTLLVQEQS